MSTLLLTLPLADDPVFFAGLAGSLARDTRLLPLGWDAEAAETEVGSLAPVGTSADAGFLPGGDDVELVVEGLTVSAPHRGEVALLYPSLAKRFLAGRREQALPEVRALGAMLADGALAPERHAEDRVDVP